MQQGNRSLLLDMLTSDDYSYEGVGNMDLDQRERTKLETQISKNYSQLSVCVNVIEDVVHNVLILY